MKQFLKRTWKCVKTALVELKDKFVLMYQLRDNYKDLAPIDNISNGKEYLKALHWAIRNKRIKNIALTGPYGSGKSSIINTYLKRHPLIKAKHLRISMATFIESGVGKNGESAKIPVEPEHIQEGILKQLFYKVNHRRIPQSRYRKLYKGLLDLLQIDGKEQDVQKHHQEYFDQAGGNRAKGCHGTQKQSQERSRNDNYGL